jgi:hypothetical protein
LRRFVLLLALALSQQVLAINKCIVNGKTVYQEAECPQGSVQKPMAERVQPAPGAATSGPAGVKATGGPWPKLPELQPGQWAIEGNGESRPASTCGHPLQSLYSEYDQLTKLREHGCKVDASSPRRGSVQIWADCPAESKIGEVKVAIVVVSPNPQYVSVQYTRKGRPEIWSAKRIGDC